MISSSPLPSFRSDELLSVRQSVSQSAPRFVCRLLRRSVTPFVSESLTKAAALEEMATMIISLATERPPRPHCDVRKLNPLLFLFLPNCPQWCSASVLGRLACLLACSFVRSFVRSALSLSPFLSFPGSRHRTDLLVICTSRAVFLSHTSVN